MARRLSGNRSWAPVNGRVGAGEAWLPDDPPLPLVLPAAAPTGEGLEAGAAGLAAGVGLGAAVGLATGTGLAAGEGIAEGLGAGLADAAATTTTVPCMLA